jgi:hypothetical protein
LTAKTHANMWPYTSRTAVSISGVFEHPRLILLTSSSLSPFPKASPPANYPPPPPQRPSIARPASPTPSPSSSSRAFCDGPPCWRPYPPRSCHRRGLGEPCHRHKCRQGAACGGRIHKRRLQVSSCLGVDSGCHDEIHVRTVRRPCRSTSSTPRCGIRFICLINL